MVGEKTWEKWMANVCKPFTMAKIRYFDATEFEAAKTWLRKSEPTCRFDVVPGPDAQPKLSVQVQFRLNLYWSIVSDG